MEKKKLNVKYAVLLPIVLIVTVLLLALPTTAFGIDGLNVIQQRVIALFVFAALMWMFEIIPNWTTSLLVIVVSLLTVSNKGIGFLCDPKLGQLVNFKDLMASFADPVVMLFMGGFVLAIMAEKYGLDVTLARVLLKPFGTKPRMVLLGFLLVIAIFSMFMSNTATAAMMLAFLAPVLAVLPKDDKGKIGLALAIPVAANLGGIGTPIGTPPNATAVKFLGEAGYEVSFMDWSVKMIPYVIIMLFVAWVLLQLFFPFKSKEVKLQIPENNRKADWKTYVVWIVFIGTILLWATEQWTKINSNVVALIPLGVFCALGIFGKEDIKEINWSVLWLVAGGFALGTCLQGTGLAKALIESIPFGSMSVVLVLLIAGFVCYFLSNFISNSATAALLIPILIVVAEGMADPAASSNADFVSLGGTHAMIVFIATCASIAMLFPISTPPNAIAASTGLVETKDMTKIGIIIGVIGFALGYFWLTSWFPFKQEAPIRNLADQYAYVELKTPSSWTTLSPNGKQVLELYKKAADQIDEIYWQQTGGAAVLCDTTLTADQKAYVAINYGPWDRLTGETFLAGYPERPLGAGFYPADVTLDELMPEQTCHYTVVTRDDTGALVTMPYTVAYKPQLDSIANLLSEAANTTIVPSVANYLREVVVALQTGDFTAANEAWFATSDSRMDLVIGPVSTADDQLTGSKASYGAMVLLKDMNKTADLQALNGKLTEFQASLPVEDVYKTWTPTASDIISADALEYAGALNAGYKVIALNLPFGDASETRTILVQNVLNSKYLQIVHPAGQLVIEKDQRGDLDYDAFYWNTAFREIAHGLGVKQTLDGQDVDEALGTVALTVEKVKDNIVGQYLVSDAIASHTLGGLVQKKNAAVTFVASTIRSTRFGTADATGLANVIIYNYLYESGAITANPKHEYSVDFEKYPEAVKDLATLVLDLQAKGDAEAAEAFVAQYGEMGEDLNGAISTLKLKKIPVDIRFKK